MSAATRPPIACLGAGRMGRGIAVAFAYAGHRVAIVDFKPRDATAFAALAGEALAEVRHTLESLGRLTGLKATDIDRLVERVSVVPEAEAAAVLPLAAVVFEGVPEVVELKREALARASRLAGAAPIIASTTSTILVDDLAPAVEEPRRFLNAHWLNPAHLVPLVELSPGAATAPEVTARLTALLESIGKVPVTCAARPGYIVPRIQALAMNEAARMVEEGVASAADVDKAIKYGFGFRFAVLGLLEFIDWGGGDILYYASRYLEGALGDARYAAPDIVKTNMAEGRIGLRTGAGFLDYAGRDIAAYREARLADLATQLKAMGLARPPVLD
jgi:3-hydroxybutyryl-CoA dehydrogenase